MKLFTIRIDKKDLPKQRDPFWEDRIALKHKRFEDKKKSISKNLCRKQIKYYGEE